MKLSVLICTRNRAASLRATLAALFDQVPAEDDDYEVVVVDNASTDATRFVIADFIATLPKRHHGRLRYCYEPRPGVSHARNAGVRIAQGDVLVFVADDRLPEPLQEIYTEAAFRRAGLPKIEGFEPRLGASSAAGADAGVVYRAAAYKLLFASRDVVRRLLQRTRSTMHLR